MTDDTIRVELAGSLEGHHLLLDPDELTFGLLEDLQSGQMGVILTSLALVIVGGDLPKGIDRAGLRRLKAEAAKAVIEGVGSAFTVPTKSPARLYEVDRRNVGSSRPEAGLPVSEGADLPGVPRVQAVGSRSDTSQRLAQSDGVNQYRPANSV